MARAILLMSLTPLLYEAAAATETACKRIDAALYYDDNMWFFMGNDVYAINATGHRSHGSLSDLSPLSHHVTAAVGVELWDEYYLYDGVEETGYEDIGRPSPYYLLTYTDLNHAFAGEEHFHGLDAAVTIATSNAEEAVMAFAGCSSITTLVEDPAQPESAVANSDLGLPCDVDAALYSPDAGAPIVIKGDAFWAMSAETGKFEGPGGLTSIVLGLEGINICPYDAENED